MTCYTIECIVHITRKSVSWCNWSIYILIIIILLLMIYFTAMYEFLLDEINVKIMKLPKVKSYELWYLLRMFYVMVNTIIIL